MQPARQDLTLKAGDNVEVAFRLFSPADGGGVEPLDPTGSRFDLLLTWASGSIELSTEDDTLLLAADSLATELRWSATPEQTSAPPAGAPVVYALIRTTDDRGRRTYLTGLINFTREPMGAPGDAALDLTVQDGQILIDLTVQDVPNLASTILAIIRGGSPPERDTLEELYQAAETNALLYALTLGG